MHEYKSEMSLDILAQAKRSRLGSIIINIITKQASTIQVGQPCSARLPPSYPEQIIKAVKVENSIVAKEYCAEVKKHDS